MKHLATFAFLSLLPLSNTFAQSYCAPTFVNGCTLWRNQSVSIGSIDWTLGASDCAISDYTSLSTNITPGSPTSMVVVNGNWCGCAVWVDLDQSLSFEDTENLYSIYVGGDPSYTYDFDITLPANTPPGEYRMRVIAPWGSDGVTVGANGYGPCGAYQYGNFNDFTLNVVDNTGISEGDNDASLWMGPNPTDGLIALDLGDGTPVQRLMVFACDGRQVMELPMAASTGIVQVDLGPLSAGPYVVQCQMADGTRTSRVVVRN